MASFLNSLSVWPALACFEWIAGSKDRTARTPFVRLLRNSGWLPSPSFWKYASGVSNSEELQ